MKTKHLNYSRKGKIHKSLISFQVNQKLISMPINATGTNSHLTWRNYLTKRVLFITPW